MSSQERIHIFVTLVIIFMTEPCSSKTYSFEDDSCDVSLEYIKDETVYVTYNGGKFNSWCNYMSFIGRDEDNILDEYTLCVTPEYYQDPNCAISVEYKDSILAGAEVKFTCDNKPVKWCGKQDDYLYIELNAEKSDKSNARFKLKLEADKTYDYGATVGAIAGGVCGAIALICIIVGVVICIVCRRKRSAGVVRHPPQQTTVPLTQYNYQANYGQGYPTGVSPPGSYPQQPGQQYGQPPTAYGQPPTAYGQPPTSYGQPTPYSQPPMSYEQAMSGSQPPTTGYPSAPQSQTVMEEKLTQQS